MDFYGFDGYGGNYYNYGSGFEEVLASMFAVFVTVLVLGGVVSLALWIFRSIGLMTIAKNRGMNYPWLTWIPVVGVYTLGAIADDIQAKEGRNTVYRWLLLGGSIGGWIIPSLAALAGINDIIRTIMVYGSGHMDDIPFFSGSNVISMLSIPISIALAVLSIICLHYLYKCYKPQNATAFTVLGIFFPLLQAIFPFAIRNNYPNWIYPSSYGPGGYGDPWQQGGYYQQPGGQPPHNGYNPPPNQNGNDYRPQ